MSKETGEPLLVDGKEITSKTTFKAEAASGSADVEFIFDASALDGQDVVVYEYLYEGDERETPVVTHEDINNEGQTVSFEEPFAPETPLKDAYDKTGDRDRLLPYFIGAALCLVAIAVSGYVIYHRRKKSSAIDVDGMSTESKDE